MVKVEKDAIEEENGDEEQQEEKDVTASSEIREFTVYIWAIDRAIFRFTGAILNAGSVGKRRETFVNQASDLQSFLLLYQRSNVGYYTGKPIECAVYCFYEMNFYEFTGAINYRLLTNQGARSISVILWMNLHTEDDDSN